MRQNGVWEGFLMLVIEFLITESSLLVNGSLPNHCIELCILCIAYIVINLIFNRD